MQALTFSHMYIQGATACLVQPAHIHQQNLLQDGLYVEEELWGPRPSNFPLGHMYMQYNV